MRRQDIEREALRLFAARGIAGVSTRDIAQAVGCVNTFPALKDEDFPISRRGIDPSREISS